MKSAGSIFFLGTILLRNPFIYDEPALHEIVLADAIMHDIEDSTVMCKMVQRNGAVKIIRTKKALQL